MEKRERKKNGILIGTFNSIKYEIWYSGKMTYGQLKKIDPSILPSEIQDSNGFILLYSAGNNPYSSDVCDTLQTNEGVGLKKMEEYCLHTLKEMSIKFKTTYSIEECD